MVPQVRFTLAFLIRQVTLLCVIFATIGYLSWLNIHGPGREQASIVFLSVTFFSATGALIGGFWGMAKLWAVAGAIAGMFLAVAILADSVQV
jgi:hypothetical protein